MRLWLKDSERRPDPIPVETDDRTAVLVGATGWLVALGVLLVFFEPLIQNGQRWLIWTCVTGVALGLLGLVYTARRHSK